MKKLVILLALALALTLSALPALAEAEDDTLANPDLTLNSLGTIEVDGRASVLVEPDRAVITFGVELTEDDAQTAQTKANENINASVEAIKALGVEASDIQTDSISIRRAYSYTDGEEKEIGFTASTQLNVNVRDLTQAGEIIDAGIGAGLNTIDGVTLLSSRQAELYNQALEQAYQNAYAKAELLAKAASAELRGVSSITEDANSYSYIARANATFAEDSLASGGSTSISAGKIEISAALSAVFIMG